MLDIQELKEKAINDPDGFVLKPTGVIKLVDEIQRLRGMLHSERAQLAAQSGQEPVAWRFVHLGQLFHQSTKPESLDRFEPQHVTPLYAAPPSPANPLAIVQAALDAAAKECDGFLTDERFKGILHALMQSIRAIDPQTILDGMTK